jgi:type 1 glutamine amidotransferase
MPTKIKNLLFAFLTGTAIVTTVSFAHCQTNAYGSFPTRQAVDGRGVQTQKTKGETVLAGNVKGKAKPASARRNTVTNTAAKKIRVLIVDCQFRDFYPLGKTANLMEQYLKADKRIEVASVEDAEFLATDVISDYDVLLLHFKNYKPLKRNETAQKNLAKFVENGGGMFIFHFACGAFEDWKEFDQYAGRVWDKHKRAHDPYGKFTVEYVDRQHPITKGLENFNTSDELYTCLKDSNVPIHILAEATSKVDKKRYPMAFTAEKGKGRIFHTTLGHDERSINHKGFQILLSRAVYWLGKTKHPKTN